jgi:hypothetical protein
MNSRTLVRSALAASGVKLADLNAPPPDRRAEWLPLVKRRTPHARQRQFIDSTAKRKVIRAGRRGGKTTGIGIMAVDYFCEGRRVLYTAPTADQLDSFWYEVNEALYAVIEAGYLYKNETKHIIEVPRTKNRIKAKTAWSAETLRGDYGDLIIFDEYQLTNESAWQTVGAPMLMDNNGDAIFIYTPPSLHNQVISKAQDPLHAAKLFKAAQKDTTGLWGTFTFSSHENPHISADAISLIAGDMTALAYRQEIEAEDVDEAPGALWSRVMIEALRIYDAPQLRRIVVGVDPPGGRTECGIVVAGVDADDKAYVLGDYSTAGSPETWSAAVVQAYTDWKADRVIVERNFGGDMAQSVIRLAPGGENISLKEVTATRGKAIRAEPVAAQYERERVHHIGNFPRLETEMVGWQPDSNMASPNRLDALVWALTELMLVDDGRLEFVELPDSWKNWRG